MNNEEDSMEQGNATVTSGQCVETQAKVVC